MYYSSVSFSYLRSAAGVSFDIKKACRKPYTSKRTVNQKKEIFLDISSIQDFR
jgi:hypothetical protein